MAGEPRSYQLEPLDGSGVFLGLGPIQCLVLGIGAVLSAVGISTGIPTPIALVPAVATAAISFVRVAGRPAWEWGPAAVRWARLRLANGSRWEASLPLWPVAKDEATPMPPCLGGLELVEVERQGGSSFGAVSDTGSGTLTAVVPVKAPPFAIESPGEQERLVAGWGDVLGQFAANGGVVTHVCWSSLARPSTMPEHQAWLAALQTPPNAATASYYELVDAMSSVVTRHEVVVGVTVARTRLGRRGGTARRPDDQLRSALASSIDTLVRGLRSADLAPDGPLDVQGLRRLLRVRVDPVGPPTARRRTGRLAERLGYLPASAAGALLVEAGWRHVRVDAAWHRTWWVASWPRLAVPPSWMEPFLAAGDVTRTVTVLFAPVPAHQSKRRIERDLVKLESDAEAKEEKGRRIDARHRRATRALLEREEELVAGYVEMAYTGLVTVSATSEDELEAHAEIVEHRARESGIDLRVLDGRQDIAWAASLPFGLAPRSLWGS